MRTYHIFRIKKEYYSQYNDNPELLFKALSTLFNIKLNNFSFGLSIYEQLCKPINVNYLSDYLNDRFNIEHNKHKYLVSNDKKNELSLLFINPSHITVTTRVNCPHVLSLLYLYERRLFVIDLENKDYFWLKDYHQKCI